MKLDVVILAVIVVMVLAIAVPNLMYPRQPLSGHTVYTVRGTVCNVWVHAGGFTDVTFQHDTKQMEDFRLDTIPPLWAGMHVEMKIDHLDHSYWATILSVKRLD
jgi:hypothetical protein